MRFEFQKRLANWCVLAPFIPLVEGIAPPIPQEGDEDEENGERVGGKHNDVIYDPIGHAPVWGEGGPSRHQLNGGVCMVGDSPVVLTQGFSDFSWPCSRVVIPKVIVFYI